MKIIEQNKETRLEAIADLQAHLKKIQQSGNESRVAALQEAIQEQNEALDVIAERMEQVKAEQEPLQISQQSKPKKSWFSRLFGQGSDRDAA